jgi:hypothetical protein
MGVETSDPATEPPIFYLDYRRALPLVMLIAIIFPSALVTVVTDCLPFTVVVIVVPAVSVDREVQHYPLFSSLSGLQDFTPSA